MSWHFSQALEAAYLEATCSDGAPSAQSSENPTPQAYLCSDRMTAFSRLSRFGMTFAPLTGSHGEELLTWFRAGFRAKTYPQQAMEKELTENAPACGEKWRESSVRYDLDSSSWKTHHCLWEEDLPWSSVTLPKWGMTRNGAVYQHPTLARPIIGTGYGLLPTPTACAGGPMPELSHEPRMNARNYSKKTGKHCQVTLARYVQMWPNPVSSMSKGSSPNALVRKSGKDRSNDRLDHAVMASEGGQLNPEWVEWLMNWPIGWTSLEPLSNEEFKFWQETGATHLRGEGVRDVWYANDPSETPQGSGSEEQCTGECPDPVPGVSQSCACGCRGLGQGVGEGCEMRNMPDGIQAEEVQAINSVREQRVPKRKGEAIGRIALGVKFRSDRLKAAGNGQVPRVAATSFNMMMRDL